MANWKNCNTIYSESNKIWVINKIFLKTNKPYTAKGFQGENGIFLNSFSHYYPYGSVMPGRTMSNTVYKYGFNGKEKDPETFEGAYDFGARVLDSRLGRWLTLDPAFDEFPYQSPYCAMANSPVTHIDKDGKREFLVTNIYDQNGKLISTTTTILSESYHEVSGFDSDGDRVTRYYDKYHVVNQCMKSDLSGYSVSNKGTYLSDNYIMIYEPWASAVLANIYRAINKFATTRGGKMLTTKEGGLDQTKAPKNIGANDLLNTDKLLKTLSLMGVPHTEGLALTELSFVLNKLKRHLESMKKEKEEKEKKAKEKQCETTLCGETGCIRTSETVCKEQYNKGVVHHYIPNQPNVVKFHVKKGKTIKVECK